MCKPEMVKSLFCAGCMYTMFQTTATLFFGHNFGK